MDSSIPSRSRPKRQDQEPDQQPRKKARGRPLKNSDDSNVPEERRAQIRRAQEAFRLRKLAATKSLETKVKSLEACVQDMSTILVDLSDSLIRSDILHQDPAVGQSLVAATSKFITLAKDAMDESDNSADPGPPSVAKFSDRETNTTQLQPTSGEALMPFQNQRMSPVAPTSRISMLEDFNPVPASLLENEVFGNGWFGLQPEMLSQLSPKNGDLDRLDSSFGVKLLQTTLSIAYDYLMDESGSHHDTIMHIYGFALMYHTKQELLFNLRWFLGPGIRALRALGRAVFGFHSSLSLQYLNAISSDVKPKILNPLVDALALVEAQKKYPTIQYLNAFDVENYIISKGAFYIGQDIVRLKISDDDRLGSEWPGNTPNLYNTNRTTLLDEMPGYLPTTAEDFPSALEFSSISTFPPESSVSTNSSNDWNGRSNFDSDTQDQIGRKDTSLKDIHQTIPIRGNVRTLSVPVLLQNLAKRSQCLGTGPGYPTSTVDLAIELATVDYSLY
ncbi:hypothetical protein BKA64DRAFT_295511 [Cadophora sp. MPI-SDFR-AT-0126]|nr:hypothetical protein BKA64DRAFT_295511 [Leotiomycetes sp. MPI-SDFR-AT-0126]